jgi:hypothetical protein
MRNLILFCIGILLVACGGYSETDLLLHGEMAKNNCRIRLAEQGYVDPDFAPPVANYRNLFNDRDLITVDGVATARESDDEVTFSCVVDRTAFNDYVKQDQAGTAAGEVPDVPVEITIRE